MPDFICTYIFEGERCGLTVAAASESEIGPRLLSAADALKIEGEARSVFYAAPLFSRIAGAWLSVKIFALNLCRAVGLG